MNGFDDDRFACLMLFFCVWRLFDIAGYHTFDQCKNGIMFNIKFRMNVSMALFCTKYLNNSIPVYIPTNIDNNRSCAQSNKLKQFRCNQKVGSSKYLYLPLLISHFFNRRIQIFFNSYKSLIRSEFYSLTKIDVDVVYFKTRLRIVY